MPEKPGQASSEPVIGQAPGELATLQAFVNTLDLEQGTDDIATPAALDDWLVAAGLVGLAGPAAPQDRSGRADLAQAVALREALRAVLRSHVTHGPARAQRAAHATARETDPAARLAEIAAGLPASITADAGGAVRVQATGAGSRGALARLLLVAAAAATLGTWERLKVCSADDCQWAFYDRSPTRSGCWCSMQVCGSRAKSRAYRSRRARAT